MEEEASLLFNDTVLKSPEIVPTETTEPRVPPSSSHKGL